MKKLIGFFCDKSLLFFLLIGLGNTVITMVGCQLLYGALGYWGSTALMFALTSVISFVLNRRYSFESKAPLVQSAVRFAVVIAVCYLVSFGVSDVLVPWALSVLSLGALQVWAERIAMLVAQVLFTGCNYLGQRLWAFKK